MTIESTEAWAAFVEMRKAKGKRAPLTDRAAVRILFELRRMAADGQDPEEVLWASVTNGWSGVFPIRRAVATSYMSAKAEENAKWIRGTSLDRSIFDIEDANAAQHALR